MKSKLAFRSSLVMAAAVVMALTSCSGAGTTGTEAASVQLSFSHCCSADTTWGTAVQQFARDIEEGSDSTVQLQVVPGSQLAGGDSIKEIELMQTGDIDMGVFPIGNISGQIPQTNFPQLPFLFDSYEHGARFLTGPYAETMNGWFDDKDLHVIAYGTAGFRDFVSTEKLFNTPDDIRGASIRIGAGEVYRETFEALGTKPVDIPYGDLYAALQQGAVNAAENPATFILNDNFYEVAPYLTRVNYMYQPVVVAVSAKTWDGLDAPTQELLADTAQSVFGKQLTDAKNDDDEAVAEMESAGLTSSRLSAEELEEYRKVVSPVTETFKDKFGDELSEFLSAVDASR